MKQLYEVARGSLKMVYPPGGTPISAPKAEFITQGELVPEGLLSEEEIKSLLEDGRITKVRNHAHAKVAPALKQKRGKWSVDPETLAGKNMEELTMLILGIDEDFDVGSIKSKAGAIEQLTKDWDAIFASQIAKAYDINTPGLSVDGVKNIVNEADPSAKVRSTLERAKAKAQALQENAEQDG